MKYKAEDKVRIKSLDWYNENKDENIDFNTPLVLQMTSKMSLFCDDVVTIKEVHYNYYSIYEDNNTFCWTDEMIEGLVEEEKKLSDESWRYKNIFDSSQYPQSFECPEGYKFVDENGNIINTTKIVLEKKKKEYPKTYEECCKTIGVHHSYLMRTYMPSGTYKIGLIDSFQRLLICRDAYWKIAGEEMGLGKPWEPDYDSGVDKFGIVYFDNTIMRTGALHRWERHLNKVLEFPTEEMRDAFYENFKEIIESCKELL